MTGDITVYHHHCLFRLCHQVFFLLEGPDTCDALGTDKLQELGSLEKTNMRTESHLFPGLCPCSVVIEVRAQVTPKLEPHQGRSHGPWPGL